MGMAISRQCCGSRTPSVERSEPLQLYDQAQQPQTNALQLELEPSVNKTHHGEPCVIDHLSYPHIIDAILEHRESWLPMSSTCRHYHRRLMPQVYRRLVLTLKRKPMRVKSRRTRLQTALTPRLLIFDSNASKPARTHDEFVHLARHLRDVRVLDVVGRPNWHRDKTLSLAFQRNALSLPVETIRFVGPHPTKCDPSFPPFRAKSYVFLDPVFLCFAPRLRGMPQECSKIVTHLAIGPKLHHLLGVDAPTWTLALNRVWVLWPASRDSSIDYPHLDVRGGCINRLAARVAESLCESWSHFASAWGIARAHIVPPKRIFVDFHVLRDIISEREFRESVRHHVAYTLELMTQPGHDPTKWSGVSVAVVMKLLIFLTRDEYIAQVGREQAAAELEVGYDWRLMAGM